ncbi:hypothetical protein [Flavobacterium sp. XS2P14]|uniref:hypothetical protein n=1 Tax=Flavobacterium sp. XS2P14 TaxID=3401735 RepID=UPI003AABBD2D
MKQIEQLSKLLPFGSVFIILCSSIKLVVFYKIFKISIVEYIGISEYLTFFIDDILYYIAIFGIGLTFYVYNTDFTETNTLIEIDWRENIKSIIFISGLIVTIIILKLILYNNSEIESDKYQIIGVGIFIILCLLHVLSSKINFNFPYPIFILLSIITYTFMEGNSDAYKKIENANKSNTVIELKDYKIVTNSKLIYLGKTEKYFFLFKIDTKTSVIIPNENVIQIKIK